MAHVYSFLISKILLKGGVGLADVTKSSRSFGGRGSEAIECPVDIDDYLVAPSVFPENDDGEFSKCVAFSPAFTFIFKIFGKVLGRPPHVGAIRRLYSPWKICWSFCILADGITTPPTVLIENDGSTAVGSRTVGFVSKAHLISVGKYGRQLLDFWVGL